MRIAKEGEVRKQELLDAALQLFCEKGYDRTSVNDILDAVGVSKGAFYYYFESKEQVLDAIAMQETERIVAITRRIAADPTLTAIQKYSANLTAVQQYRAANADQRYSIHSVLGRDENAKLARRVSEATLALSLPVFQTMIVQGVREGSFQTDYPEETAELIIRMGMVVNAKLAQLRQEQAPPAVWLRTLTFYEEALERLLGIRERGAIGLVRATMAAFTGKEDQA
ncbi:MAG TPA: TetR/AcrR family transcriptional regulator [Symbiobacteriaceae bacterium]|nr:TetR/AcrR family transcriptional regulator [Symbiobacteriaceae bacterium]